MEKDADGGEISNREYYVSYGTSGLVVLDLTIESWRDHLVAEFTPSAGATDVSVNTQITVTWSKAMDPETEFVVIGPMGVVSGTFSYNPITFTVTFTPLSPLDSGTQYTVRVLAQTDSAGDVQQIPEIWSFTTAGFPIRRIYLPVVGK